MFGIRISLFFSIVFLGNISNAQIACPCNENDCLIDSFFVDFVTIGVSNVVCDGEEFIVRNTTKIPNVEFFIFDWGDGAKDTIYDLKDIKHTYNITENSICNNKKTIFEPCLVGVTTCGNKITCNSKRNAITVVHAPRAKFTVVQEICKGRTITFTNGSCNVEETDSLAYIWDFGDGSPASHQKNPTHVYPTPGNYSVRLTVKNGCGSHTSPPFVVRVLDFPDAVIGFSENAKDSVVCLYDVVTIKDKSNQWAVNNEWTYPQNKNPHKDTLEWKVLKSILIMDSMSYGIKDSVHFIDSIVLQFIKVGSYKFMLKSMNICSTVVSTVEIKVTEPTEVELKSPYVIIKSTNLSAQLMENIHPSNGFSQGASHLFQI